MLDIRAFSVPGKPTGKGRPRMCIRGGHAAGYTPAKTVAYENLVKLSYISAHGGSAPIPAGVPVCVVIQCLFAIPQSWSVKRKAAAKYHTGKPDADNVIKAVCDALNGIAWHDDSQVVDVSCSKTYDVDGSGECVNVSFGLFNTN